ncbi:MAG: sulfatase-like hydrolase/transferase [Acidobacteria bacterium]|nr:sulfatase-like hydrolase/transferase [Acidobacteriota bacterium]
MDRRDFVGMLAGTAAATGLCGVSAFAAEKQKRPNIVFLLVDDLGWGDFSCYGSSFHETPHIDQLAREGMKFTSAYAGAPVCSPSRAAIMTGQTPARLHLTEWIHKGVNPHKKLLPAEYLLHLPKGVPTIASELKKLGYTTGAIGKWHLGPKGYWPEDFGFDYNVAGDEHGHPAPPHGYFGPFYYHNLTGYTENDNLTEVLTNKVDEFLSAAAPKGPFFLYLAEYAVHEPLAERKPRVDKYLKKNGGKDEPDPTYAAVVESVDRCVARLRKKLTELGVADNTIIMLTSDNGGVSFDESKFKNNVLHRVADNGPFRAGKGYVYEGGIRTADRVLAWRYKGGNSERCAGVWAGLYADDCFSGRHSGHAFANRWHGPDAGVSWWIARSRISLLALSALCAAGWDTCGGNPAG